MPPKVETKDCHAEFGGTAGEIDIDPVAPKFLLAKWMAQDDALPGFGVFRHVQNRKQCFIRVSKEKRSFSILHVVDFIGVEDGLVGKPAILAEPGISASAQAAIFVLTQFTTAVAAVRLWPESEPVQRLVDSVAERFVHGIQAVF
ncbi:hypothetical protein [Woeseia oceani]|uniref:hypothetical protein n=1 Tax=Woeseia oceani TaxID=1548547 RepID=UPI001E322C92|nr:hypothetical protein [Woeseia oceani]